MRLSAFIDGLHTLLPYYDDADGFHIGAEHDQFYAYETDRPLPDEAVKKMRALGWFQPEQDSDEYDHLNGWSAFT